MKLEMMKCGHAQNGRDGEGNYVCVICNCKEKDDAPPSLEERMAECHCGRKMKSDPSMLAFFEFRGEGSREAKDRCKNCSYYEVAHSRGIKCQNFVPHGAFETDKFYCGCNGWD
jgi:hypothetical protein